MNRREAIKAMGAAGVGLAASSLVTPDGNAEPAPQTRGRVSDPTVPPPHGVHPRHDMRGYGIPLMRQQVAMLVYPGVTALDLIGPHQILSRMGNVDINFVWKTRDLVTTDGDFALQPTLSFADCPDNLTVLFVPGGLRGTADLMADTAVLDFLAHKGKTARYITSICTGSLILGAAGLLRGYRATSHWLTRDFLTGLGAHPVKARVVEDRNRITGAGVTAGLDFALHLVARLRNEKMAKALQLANEYDPQPPYQAGKPESAPPAVTQMEWAMNIPYRDDIRDAVRQVEKRWKA
jgi:cyclohexyl-isocyanide hydratase